MSGKDFDPLDGLFSNIVLPATDPLEWLERMQDKAPGEALDSPQKPQEKETGPVRRVRSESPDFLPAPLLPYPFDGSEKFSDDIEMLCSLTMWAPKQRQEAVVRLLHAYEARNAERLDLHTFLKLWWCAARRYVDIAAENGFPSDRPDLPQRPASAFFGKLQRAVAFDFTAAKGVPDHLLRETLQAAGVPVPPVPPKRRKKV